MKIIPLTKGKEVVIDSEMFSVVSKHKWHYREDKNTGYAQASAREGGIRTTLSMHILIFTTVNGPIPDNMSIDHINGNGLDNRMANLRLADRRLQRVNSVQRRLGLLSSSLAGVTWMKRSARWRSQIELAGYKYHLGLFDDEYTAHKAYQQALQAYNENGTLPTERVTSSTYKGVSWNTRDKRWQSHIKLNNKKYHLGYFKDELLAYQAYLSAKEAYNTDGTLPTEQDMGPIKPWNMPGVREE